MHKSRTLACAVAVAVCGLAAGCGPTPSDRTAENYRATQFADTPVDQRLDIDGCKINVHRVTTRVGDAMNDFTLATARCPTATVTSVGQGCGRSCAANTILVEPGASATAPADVPTAPDAR